MLGSCFAKFTLDLVAVDEPVLDEEGSREGGG